MMARPDHRVYPSRIFSRPIQSYFFLLFIFVFFGTAILFANSLLQLSGRIPSYENQLQNILDSVSRYLPEAGVTVESALQDIAAFAFGVSTDIISGALSAGSTLMLIFITTTFLLLDAAGAPKRVQRENEDQPIHILRFTELSKTSKIKKETQASEII